MIIAGYPCIGKSSLALERADVIDLESSVFCDEKGDRDPNWYIQYCKVAEYLSKQGYIVFVSSHLIVTTYLLIHTKEVFCIIYPSLDLKDRWILRLKNRFLMNHSDKNLRAVERATEFYEQDILNIIDLWLTKNALFHRIYEIKSMSYNLSDIVDKLKHDNRACVIEVPKDVVDRWTDYLKSAPSNPIPIDIVDEAVDTSEWPKEDPYIDKSDS